MQAEVYAPNHIQPDTALLIHQSVQASYNGQMNSGTYVLTLKDIVTKRDIWSAVMTLQGPSALVSDRGKGAALFADQIAGQLGREGVLKACPAPVTSPPPS